MNEAEIRKIIQNIFEPIYAEVECMKSSSDDEINFKFFHLIANIA